MGKSAADAEHGRTSIATTKSPSSALIDAARSASGSAREGFASLQHVVQGSEGHHVVAAIAAALDAREHPPEVDRALARTQVFFVAAVAVGQPYLAAATEIHRVEEPVDTFG